MQLKHHACPDKAHFCSSPVHPAAAFSAAPRGRGTREGAIRPRGRGNNPDVFVRPHQNVLRKVQHQDALQISDVVMASLLRMFQSTAGSGGVQEDALMAVSTLVEGRSCATQQACPLLPSLFDYMPKTCFFPGFLEARFSSCISPHHLRSSKTG